MKILITGIAGTGKTHVLSELQKLGFLVVDLDATGFCRWQNNETGEATEYGQGGRDATWLSRHGWYCDIPKLKELLKLVREDKHVFVGGIVDNIQDVVKEFDKIFYLSANKEVIKERLTNRTNNNFGKTDDEQKEVLNWANELKQNLKNVVIVDANQSLEEVTKFILENLSSQK